MNVAAQLLMGFLLMAGGGAKPPGADPPDRGEGGETEAARDAAAREGLVQCANLVYARNKSSVCFSDKFLRRLKDDTDIHTEDRFRRVKLESDELFDYPFAIMTGEGHFRLTEAQRKNLRRYLERGGFLLASAGCSSSQWDRSFREELGKVFGDRKLEKLSMDHVIFRTVHDIHRLRSKHPTKIHLEGLTIDGRLVLVYSDEGLNDTSNAGKGCCCCGGNEILNAQDVNANILAYALTH
jgi:hypothetical protein